MDEHVAALPLVDGPCKHPFAVEEGTVMEFNRDRPLDDFDKAVLAHSMAAFNGLSALLMTLATKNLIDRDDVAMVANGITRAYTAPDVRDNMLIAEFQKNADDLLTAALKLVA